MLLFVVWTYDCLYCLDMLLSVVCTVWTYDSLYSQGMLLSVVCTVWTFDCLYSLDMLLSVLYPHPPPVHQTGQQVEGVTWHSQQQQTRPGPALKYSGCTVGVSWVYLKTPCWMSVGCKRAQ